MTTQPFVGILLAGMFCGCASGPSTTAIQPPSQAADGAPSQPPPGDSRVITSEQLSASAASNLYDAIARLRPLWLRGQGSRVYNRNIEAQIVVIVDESYLGDPTVLRGIQTDAVNGVRFLSAQEAVNAYPWISNRTDATGRGMLVESAIVVYHATRVPNP